MSSLSVLVALSPYLVPTLLQREKEKTMGGGEEEQAHLRLPEDPDHLDSELKVIR